MIFQYNDIISHHFEVVKFLNNNSVKFYSENNFSDLMTVIDSILNRQHLVFLIHHLYHLLSLHSLASMHHLMMKAKEAKTEKKLCRQYNCACLLHTMKII